MLIDLFVSRIPFHFLHFFYPVSFSGSYIIFTLIYWGAGGTNHNGRPYVYSTLDYGSDPVSAILAIVVIVAPMVLHLVLFLVAWLRDVIYVRVGCCFCDVKELPYGDSEPVAGGAGGDVNGRVKPQELTEV